MFRSFRHRNYRLFFAGQMTSLTGTWMQSMAQSWLIYRLSHSAFLLGLAGFVGQVPGFVLAPVGGAIADRISLRKTLFVTQISAALLALFLAALTLSGAVQVWHVLVVSALLSIVNAFDMPARQAIVVELVSREDMVNAIGLNSSMFNGARVIGPSVAGALLATVGEGWCFFANAVSYLALVVGLAFMKFPKKERPHRVGSHLDEIIEGFRFVATDFPLRTSLLLLAIVSLMTAPYGTLMPIIADEILKGGPRGLGILMGMSGVGALVGALVFALKQDLSDLSRWIAVCTIAGGCSLIAFSLSRSFWLSAVLLLPVGFFLMIQMASINTLIQSNVPDRLRGRVLAIYVMTFLGIPLGSLVSGVLAKPLGSPLTIALGGAVCLVSGFYYSVQQVRGAV